MKKIRQSLTLCFLSAMLSFISYTSKAQNATIENGVATYLSKNYAVGDTINLGYGTLPNKSFAYIYIGSAMAGTTELERNWAKAEAIIDKVYKSGKTVMLRAKLIDKTVNALGGNKLFINLDSAIDNKELL